MDGPVTLALRTGWISLAIVGVAIFVFGLVVTVMPIEHDAPFLRSIGVASIGMGLFGFFITVIAFRRRERWAWLILWYYPLFWIAHVIGHLPPGKEQLHQVAFIAFSLAGLLVPLREFFPRKGS